MIVNARQFFTGGKIHEVQMNSENTPRENMGNKEVSRRITTRKKMGQC